jgi:hypothetical protein
VYPSAGVPPNSTPVAQPNRLPVIVSALPDGPDAGATARTLATEAHGSPAATGAGAGFVAVMRPIRLPARSVNQKPVFGLWIRRTRLRPDAMRADPPGWSSTRTTPGPAGTAQGTFDAAGNATAEILGLAPSQGTIDEPAG